MGLVWMVVTPLMMLSVYTFVFSVIFKARWGAEFGDSKVAFALILFCGIAVFNIFSESIQSAVTAIAAHPNYVKKVVFPLEVLPVVAVLSAVFFGLVWLGILTAGVLLCMQKICLTLIGLPFVMIPLFLFCCGMAWFMASLGVYVRDLGHVTGVILQILFFLTPICYGLDVVPEPYQSILRYNPLTVLIQTARLAVIYNRWPDWASLGWVTVLSLAVFQMGYFWFMKTKRGFADVL